MLYKDLGSFYINMVGILNKYKLSKSKTIYIEPNVCSNKRTVWNNNKQKEKYVVKLQNLNYLKFFFKNTVF